MNPMSESRDARLKSVAVILVMVFLVAAFLRNILSSYDVANILDDGYMSVRYIDNILNDHVIAWNPGGPATYGMTSLLLLLDVFPFRLLFPQNAALAVAWSSIINGSLFLVALAYLVTTKTSASKTIQRIAALIVFVIITHAATHLVPHFLGGLDTCFTLLYLTIYLIVAKRLASIQTRGSAIAVGILGGLAFFVRPDLMIFTLLVPFVLVLFAPDKTAARLYRQCFVLTLIVLGCELIGCYLYFHSALPLPFYVKGMKRYGAEVYRLLAHVPRQELYEYIKSYWPLMLAAVGWLIMIVRRRQYAQAPVEIAIALGTILYIAYYALFVLQVMYYNERFYYPTLPAIAFLGAHGLAMALTEVQERVRQMPNFALRVRTVLSIFVIIMIPVALLKTVQLVRAIKARPSAPFDLAQAYQDEKSRWFALDQFSALPDSVQIATTEVGLPSVMCSKKQIIDLAGLHETEIAHRGFTASRFFQKYRPEVIYLPHPAYADMIQEIVQDPTFQAHYDYYPPQKIGSVMGVGILRESNVYSSLHHIMSQSKTRLR